MSSYQISAYAAEVAAVPAGTAWPSDFDEPGPIDEHGISITGAGNSFALEGTKAELLAIARAVSAAVDALPHDGSFDPKDQGHDRIHYRDLRDGQFFTLDGRTWHVAAVPRIGRVSVYASEDHSADAPTTPVDLPDDGMVTIQR